MQRTSSARLWPQAVAVLALAALHLIAGWWAWRESPQWLLAQWQSELSKADETRALALLRQIAATSEEGLQAVAANLASSDARLSAIACQVLHERLDDCERQPGPGAVRTLRVISAGLCTHEASLLRQAPSLAAELASRASRCARQAGIIDARLEAICRRLADAAPTEAAPDFELAESATNPASIPARDEYVVAAEEPAAATEAPATLPPTTPDSAEPLKAAGDSHIASPGSANEPATLDGAFGTSNPLRRQAPDDEGSPRAPPQPAPIAPSAGRNPALVTKSAGQLIKALRGAPPELAASILEELRARDWPWEWIEVARGVTHVDARVRLRFAQVLPRMEGLDANWWLLLLSEDDAADVRYEALAALAGSNDPRLQKEVQKRAAGDSDLRIRNLAERLARDIRR